MEVGSVVIASNTAGCDVSTIQVSAVEGAIAARKAFKLVVAGQRSSPEAPDLKM
jgi:hypothetical protein